MEKEDQEEKKAREQLDGVNLNDNSAEPKLTPSLMLK